MFLHASVILSTGGVSASVHAGIHNPPQSRHPPSPGSKHTPPGADPPRDPPGSRLPRADTPPTRADNPPSRHPLHSRHPLPPPGADTPREADTPPGSRLRHTVNERPVRILLECILVTQYFCQSMNNLFKFFLIDFYRIYCAGRILFLLILKMKITESSILQIPIAKVNIVKNWRV